MAQFNRLAVSQQDDVTVVQLIDRELSDLLVQDAFHEEVMRLVSDVRPSKLLIQFKVVNYCNTGIINTLITAKKRVVEYGGVMKLCELSPHVHDAFLALNLEGTVFDVYPSQAEAMAAFAE